jgi:rhodanese-related sulfurtransferase
VSVDDVLAIARSGLVRMSPAEAAWAQRGGALLIDTRTEGQRRQQGELPGAIVVDRTVLEWRLDPLSAARIAEATAADLDVIVVCRQGYSSSLAAASLQSIGLHRATDMIGGAEAWIAAGLPIHHSAADVRR